MENKIIIKNLKVFAYHGVLPEEKENGQEFFLDITLEVDSERNFESDDLGITADYSEVCRIAEFAMKKEKYNLIEKAAQVVAENILAKFSVVERVCVRVKKPHAPMPYDFNYVAAEVNLARLKV